MSGPAITLPLEPVHVPKDDRCPPLVAHVIFRFSVGGLENGLVNLINWMPSDRYRHAIICLTESTDFKNRLRRKDVPVFELHKQPGHDFGVYTRMWKTLRTLSPDIVHTRNLPSLEYLALTAMASQAGRIHGEHGRDVYDLDGTNRKYNLLRRMAKPFVHRYTAVSTDLKEWLVGTIGICEAQVHQIYNGVDIERFCPPSVPTRMIGPDGFVRPGNFVLGTVGRMQDVKDQLTLIRAFLHLLDTEPSARTRVRLVVIGDGPLKQRAEALLKEANAERLAWMPGECDDIPRVMQSMDLFVLPSLAEGISNTILEAMACGLPVVATNVGGNPELVDDGATGRLVPPADPVAMAQMIQQYLCEPDVSRRHGEAGRRKVLARFSPQKMVEGYLSTYDAVLRRSGSPAKAEVAII